MNKKAKETIIISLGGSLVAPSGIDMSFLRTFKHCLERHFTKRFFILVGGGKIARDYQKALTELGAKPVDKDWAGINVTRLNAEVVKHLFAEKSYEKIITDPTKKIKTNKDIVVGAGWKPGWSTDYDAVLIAKNHGIKIIVNLSNIDYVYDKDPDKFSDAKRFEKVDWKTFRHIVGDEWVPGLSMPFDPIASKIAQKLKMKVVIMNGQKLDHLEYFLDNKPFIGTTIE